MNRSQQFDPTFRTNATAAGVLFLVTHVGSIGGAALYGPVLHNEGITGGMENILLLGGALLETVTALAVVGTAVALYPAVRRHREGLSLGYVSLRTLEAANIAVSVIALMLVAAAQSMAGTSDSFSTWRTMLTEFHGAAFLVGPGLVCATNTVVIAYVLYKSRLVPRFIPMLGLIGGPLIIVMNVLLLFGELPAWSGLAVVPIFAWELSLALCLIIRGFNPKTVVAPVAADSVELALAV